MKVIDLGLSNYSDCYKLQKRLLNEVKNNSAEDHIIITEHYPVITIGRTGSRNNILVSQEFLESRGVEVIEVDRGGDITYHGPGQIVVYPIIDLKRHFRDVHRHLRYLEDIVIQLLQNNNINSFNINGKTGVWTNTGKIASIGIGVSGWVTFHGLVINVDCDLTPFRWINPCGFKGINIISMEELSGINIDKERTKSRLIDLFCEKYENSSTMA